MPGSVLSLVLVVHREQGWLPQLIDSLLDQGFADFELVAVDDASPDHAPAMLDDVAGRDERVRVRHLDARAGLAEARRIGLEMAEGDHVWFVHSTDLVPPGALASVAERLGSAKPDVLRVQYAREDMFGDRREMPLNDEALPVWNKVFRRGLLTAAPFADSEVSIVWPALLAADRVEALPATSYVRRRPPNAVPDGSRFDLFAGYDAVFDFAGAHAVPDERRRLIVPAMLRHELSQLRRLSAGERAEFFRCMSEGLRKHRRGHEPSLGSRGLELRARLVERGDYLAYQALERSIRLRRLATPSGVKAARGRVQRAAKARSRPLQRHYRAQLRRPIDPDLAALAAYWYRGYSCNPRAIYERARELVPGFHGVWVVSTDGAHTIPDGVDYVMAGTREYFDLIARAKWFVNNVNFPNNLVKREGTVHVMTHHGTPLKRMGLDLRTTPDGGERAGLPGLLRRCARWDYSISQNAFTTPIWERVYPTRYESLEVGYPRNDVLANADDDEVQRVRADLGIEPGRRAVLYAPTHREYQKEYVPVLDLGALTEGLGSDFVVLGRAHYWQSEPLARELSRQGRVVDVTEHPSIEELCLAADVLVTDYSSVMFDYAVLDRPIVIHAPDWEEYRDKRGTYFDLMAEPPGVVSRSDAELIDALRSGAAWEDEAARLRAAFRARFCPLDDGRAAERVVRRVFLGQREAVTPAAAAVAR